MRLFEIALYHLNGRKYPCQDSLEVLSGNCIGISKHLACDFGIDYKRAIIVATVSEAMEMRSNGRWHGQQNTEIGTNMTKYESTSPSRCKIRYVDITDYSCVLLPLKREKESPDEDEAPILMTPFCGCCFSFNSKIGSPGLTALGRILLHPFTAQKKN